MLGQRLRQLRKGNSLTLQQVADELGVTPGRVTQIRQAMAERFAASGARELVGA